MLEFAKMLVPGLCPSPQKSPSLISFRVAASNFSGLSYFSCDGNESRVRMREKTDAPNKVLGK